MATMQFFFLAALSNGVVLDLDSDQSSMTAMENKVKTMTFDSYDSTKHPVKLVALETALQNVQKLPKEIRVMLTNPNATLPEVTAKERARALKLAEDKADRKNAFMSASTTHGSHLVVDAGSGYNPVDPSDTQYKTLDVVRAKLNELYSETMTKMDLERAECYEQEMNLKLMIKENTVERVLLSSDIAQARGEIAMAQAQIRDAEVNLEIATHNLWQLNAMCHYYLTLAYEKKAIIEGDLKVALTVENMTDCSKMESNAAGMSLFQCMVHDGKSLVQVSGTGGQFLKNFKSKEAMQAMMRAAQMSFGMEQDEVVQKKGSHRQEPGGTSPELPLGTMTQEEFDEWSKLPSDTAWMDNVGVKELPTSCKALNGTIDIGTKCNILFDAVGQMVGEVTDVLHEQNMWIAYAEAWCAHHRGELEDDIFEYNDKKSKGQIKLTDATERLQMSQENLRGRVAEFQDLAAELHQTMNECNEVLQQLFKEMCGLITIRNELYKMSGVETYMQDCAVGEWTPGDCSKPCGTGQQTMTRDVTQEPYFGAACPPLSKVALCNEDPCPIDCVYGSEWSLWSSCSADCGGGVMARARSIKMDSQFGGEACEATQDDVTCNVQSCDSNCKLGEWTEWSGCSKMCDGGVQTQRRLEVEAARGSGTCADPDEEDEGNEDCQSAPCDRFKFRDCQTQHCLANLACNSKIDFVLVLDGSGSVTPGGFASTVGFAHTILSRVYMNYDDGATAGIVLFSKNVEIVHGMTGDRAALDTALTAMQFPSSYTDTGAAILTGVSLLSEGRTGVPGVVFIVTDGKPTFQTDTEEAAEEARRLGSRLFFVTVGTNFDLNAMYRWAAKPAKQNVVYVKDYNQLGEKITNLLSDLCPTVECRETSEAEDESDYIGCQTETTNGYTCQYWNVQTPHTHNYMPHLLVAEPWEVQQGGRRARVKKGQHEVLKYPTLGDHNFCRNPAGAAGSGGIWCYTSNEEDRWEFCDPRPSNNSGIPVLGGEGAAEVF